MATSEEKSPHLGRLMRDCKKRGWFVGISNGVTEVTQDGQRVLKSHLLAVEVRDKLHDEHDLIARYPIGYGTIEHAAAMLRQQMRGDLLLD